MRRRLLACVCLLSVLVPTSADACLAREPIAAVLREASPEVWACSEQHSLPPGRYAVRLTVDPSGKLASIELGETPGELSPAAESCLVAAFARRRFEAWASDATPRAPETVSGPGRRSRLPPDLRARPRGPGVVVIHWPFTLAGSARP